jgi:hypothetical protein
MSCTKENFEKHYQGFDKSLSISLFEYGFIFSRTDPLSEGDLRVWFRVGKNKFDCADFKQDLDFWKEFNWIDKGGFLSYIGMDENSFNHEDLERKINYAISYYGYENVCGPAYYPQELKDWTEEE